MAEEQRPSVQMRTCQALSKFKLKWTQCSRAGKLREVWGSTVPGRNKRAVSAKGKEEIRCPEVAGGSPGPVVAQQDGPRRARARDRHLHPQRLLLLCNNAQRATGVTTQQPGEKIFVRKRSAVTARDRVAIGRRAEVLGVRDLPRGSIVWRVPDVRARPDLNGIIRRDQVLAHGEVADVDPAGTQWRLSSVVQSDGPTEHSAGDCCMFDRTERQLTRDRTSGLSSSVQRTTD